MSSLTEEKQVAVMSFIYIRFIRRADFLIQTKSKLRVLMSETEQLLLQLHELCLKICSFNNIFITS